jgi:hypothetical protein
MSAASVTWTDIANIALGSINQERLASIDDTTLMAQRIRDMRRQVATEVLEEHDWGSATNRQTLSAKTGTPVGLWLQHFSLPSDFVKPTAVWNYSTDELGVDSHGGPYRHDWKAEGSTTLYVGEKTSEWPAANTLNSEKVAIAYVAYTETDLGKWSPSLRRCMALKIAVELAIGTTGDAAYLNSLENRYARQLRRAQTLDTSLEGTALQRYSNDDHTFHHGGN